MKKIFTLFAAMSALSFSTMADAATYQIENRYEQILFTNSDYNTAFFATVLSAEEMAELAEQGITVDTPQALLEAAADIYLEDNVLEYVDDYGIILPWEGTWTAVAASVEEQDGQYVFTSAPTIATFDVVFRVLDNPANLTFDVSMNGSEMTVTPSDLNQKYLYSYVNVENCIEEYGQEPTLEFAEEVLQFIASIPISYRAQGVVSEDLAEDSEENPYGNYKFFAVAVEPDEVDVKKWGWYLAGDIFMADFVYGDPSSIKIDVEGTEVLRKAIREGRIILNGKYSVDGKVIR